MKRDGEAFALGIDLGGTFVKGALVSDRGRILEHGKLPIGPTAQRNDILNAIGNISLELLQKAKNLGIQVQGMGIGTPGIVYDGVVLGGADNLQGWENVDLAGHCGKLLGCPVKVDNDANVMGFGELHYGAAKGCTDVICLTIGTGIGGAIIINGAIYGGHKGRGGELGHIAVEHNGADCNCGGRGCLEIYGSTTALVKRYAALTGLPVEDVDGKFIVSRFKDGEIMAQQCLEEQTAYLGHGIASFVNVFAPQKVVLGGGIAEAGEFYIEMVRNAATSLMMPDCGAETEIVAAQLGNKAGSLGAAALVFKG